MNVDTQQNTLENNLQQVDTSLNQVKSDANLTQQNEQAGNGHDGNAEDPNWRAFREARKKDRSEREAAEQRAREKEAEVTALKAAMEAAFAKQNPVPQQNYYSEQEREETEEERIDKRVNAAIAAREAQAEQQRRQREIQEYPQRLVKDFHDFNGTISQENLDYLDFHYPEVSRPLQRLHDGYDKWADIYRAVKKFVPNSTTAKKEAARADANFSKPKSMSSTGITQPGEAMSSSRLSEEKRAENWARMQRVLKGVG